MPLPRSATLALARLFDARVFVETGTYHGETARWASEHFDAVYTVERSETLAYSTGLAAENVRSYCGDSRVILPEVVKQVNDRRAIYWLDAHWSCGDTVGEDDECPLLGELAISSWTNAIVLIDDARLFLSVPPPPHDPAQWPTVAEVMRAIPAPMFVQVVNDVIFAVPQELRPALINYAREQ